MNISISNETPAGHSIVDNLTREAGFVAESELGLRNPIYSLIRAKAGISLYRVKSEGKSLVLKVFEKQDDVREIENYQILSSLGIPTLPLLGSTQNAILLPDVEASSEYWLGMENDLSDPQVARAIAKWYRELHTKGRTFLADKRIPMYDELELITLTNLELVAERTDTKDRDLWRVIREHFNIIRSRIDALPRTLTYNDFYWTNLIVSKDHKKAFMFDYNLLGKGIAYGDIRNVTGSLSHEAADAFLEEYGNDIAEEQIKADAFIAPLVTLFLACKREDFPSWANASLMELKNGDILRHLKEWLFL
ncbi:MAG: phosphotransferase [Lachnospiraceae bacterium]|nr:phosphotransferase [Lachnospiraceae bacterium]